MVLNQMAILKYSLQSCRGKREHDASCSGFETFPIGCLHIWQKNQKKRLNFGGFSVDDKTIQRFSMGAKFKFLKLDSQRFFS